MKKIISVLYSKKLPATALVGALAIGGLASRAHAEALTDATTDEKRTVETTAIDLTAEQDTEEICPVVVAAELAIFSAVLAVLTGIDIVADTPPDDDGYTSAGGGGPDCMSCPNAPVADDDGAALLDL